jgi:hypothetical protein
MPGIHPRTWNNEVPKANFIGLRCRCRPFWSFASGNHPKAIFLKVIGTELGSADAHSQAFDYFDYPEPKFQAVTIQNEYFSRSLMTQMMELRGGALEVETDSNIVDI